MPCYSTIRTKMNNADHLAAALKALGYTVDRRGDMIYADRAGRSLSFAKGYDGTFSAQGATASLPEIGRKYAETGAKEWARKRGFGILSNDGTTMTLVNRRTF